MFDGWVRYDVALTYKQTTTINGRGATAYSGPAIVCTARYEPVAIPHQPRIGAVHGAGPTPGGLDRARLKGTNLMIPYKFIIGVPPSATSPSPRSDFVITPADQQANAR